MDKSTKNYQLIETLSKILSAAEYLQSRHRVLSRPFLLTTMRIVFFADSLRFDMMTATSIFWWVGNSGADFCHSIVELLLQLL